MDAFVIEGPATLKGSVTVSGSKNSALPLLFASLLFDSEVVFENVPRLWDVETTLKILGLMGAEYQWDKEEGRISLIPRLKSPVAPYEWVRQMRAGILALGPLVAKAGHAKVSLPGGCAIGARPVNFHIDAMRKMGAEIDVEEGYIKAKVNGGLKGADICFSQVTVTGTENILVVASRAEGETTIHNAACEPEVVALGTFLKDCGAKISGLGTPSIRVLGPCRLKAPESPIVISPDRIETGTWISAAVATRSELRLKKCDASQLTSVLDAYRNLGVEFDVSPDQSEVAVKPDGNYSSINVDTRPYPGFPTDMQAQMMANMCLAQGKSTIRESIFENRFMHVGELRRLGASIEVEGNLATIVGPSQLEGAPIMATDLRASASLVVAALSARGLTRISRIYHLDRGYQRLDEKLQMLGANVRRVRE